MRPPLHYPKIVKYFGTPLSEVPTPKIPITNKNLLIYGGIALGVGIIIGVVAYHNLKPYFKSMEHKTAPVVPEIQKTEADSNPAINENPNILSRPSIDQYGDFKKKMGYGEPFIKVTGTSKSST